MNHMVAAVVPVFKLLLWLHWGTTSRSPGLDMDPLPPVHLAYSGSLPFMHNTVK